MPLSSLARRFRYHAWATHTLAEALPASNPLTARPLGHAVMADRGWRLRILDEVPTKMDFWPLWTPAEIDTNARLEEVAYRELLAGLDKKALTRVVAYESTDRTAYETPLIDILEHVLLHGSHHRGQTCVAIRTAGTIPPHVDFMAWVRLGEPDFPAVPDDA